MKKAILFDLDGTLWDSGDTVLPAWNRVLAEVQVRPLLTKEELEAGIAWAWKETYSWKNIRKRLDLTKFRTVKSIYMLVNIGYRKYAKEFEIFGADVMADNSDIPEVG